MATTLFILLFHMSAMADNNKIDEVNEEEKSETEEIKNVVDEERIDESEEVENILSTGERNLYTTDEEEGGGNEDTDVEECGGGVEMPEQEAVDVTAEETLGGDAEEEEKREGDEEAEEKLMEDVGVEEKREGDEGAEEKLMEDVGIEEKREGDEEAEGKLMEDVGIEEKREGDVGTEEKPEGAVGTGELAGELGTEEKPEGAVGTGELAGDVGTEEKPEGAVGTGELAGELGTEEKPEGAVGTGELAGDVGTEEKPEGAVGTGELAGDVGTQEKLEGDDKIEAEQTELWREDSDLKLAIDEDSVEPGPKPIPPGKPGAGGDDPEDKPEYMDESDHQKKTFPNLALNISWSFGYNKNIPVQNLTDDNRSMVVYASSHISVMYDYVSNKQWILQGHANSIICIYVSQNKKWLVTADKGKDSAVIIWDTYTYIPIQTLFGASADGMTAIALTPDSKYLATLSASEYQEFSLWDWTVNGEKPLISVNLKPLYGVQNYIYFNPEDYNQIVTNSESHVIFYQLVERSLELKWFCPGLTDQDFNVPVGKYSQSIFQYMKNRALTATSLGNLVIWETQPSHVEGEITYVANKKPLKIIKLVTSGINVLSVMYNNIVIGDMEGRVSFFNQKLMLMHRYSNFDLGPVNFISFCPLSKDIQHPEKYPRSCTLGGEPFISPDFILSSTNALCGFVKAEGPTITLIMKDHGSIVPAIVAHPYRPYLLTGCHGGFLRLCDYEKKTVLSSRQFEDAMIQCCVYSPDGFYVGVGFTNGMIYILDALTLTNQDSDIHHYCSDCITHLAFSAHSRYLAIADSGYAVCLLRKEGDTFQYIGRYRSHYQPIRDLMFREIFQSSVPLLLSLGEDRRLVEYNILPDNAEGVQLLSVDRIEQSAIPLCMTFYPSFTKEYFILTVNNEYKYKLYNSSTKMCRLTILSPTYGSPLTKVIVLPKGEADANSRYMAFITTDKIGLQVLPVDGNRHKSTAFIAHPDGVANIAASYDGKYLFTTSRKDASLHMWNINISALEAQVKLGGEDLIPFYELIEGGREGEVFHDLEKYFYYSQLRCSGIDSMETRPVTTTITITEIPFVLRAMGFYPTEEELANIDNEVKFTDYVETETFKDSINIGDFLKLLINHRPLVPPSTEQLKWAFDTLATCDDDEGNPCLLTEELLDILQAEGEHIKSDELCEILAGLSLPSKTDYDDDTKTVPRLTEEELTVKICKNLPEYISAPEFASKLLGLRNLEFSE
ncbi:cilia- and flagella-associated protein 251-like isoform X1 [Octopus sinensis]|uniref:Cilia- and flagella-associated protein 251 n=2 Tax=Octopus sinensis TaxID=2607531 RepID=A0A7E6FP42_9MOLL|nr:cilia- and flagella-associated protein 251-like isoform X1 [Octopus sinensis]